MLIQIKFVICVTSMKNGINRDSIAENELFDIAIKQKNLKLV